MHPQTAVARFWGRSMLTLLTATGCRPDAWKICQKLMERQTYQGEVHWIIVDDGEQMQMVDFNRDGWKLTVITPRPFWKQGDNTQARNLMEGVALLNGKERLFIIEDDDCYLPEYLETANSWLDKHDLVGESFARYYNVQSKRFRQLSNASHASLCATAMKGDAIEAFKRELRPEVKFIDLMLWRRFNGHKKLHKSSLVTGIKGLPGRNGIGMGHKDDFQGQIDQKGSILRQWAGVNADLYT